MSGNTLLNDNVLNDDLSVTHEDYADAVIHLFKLAQGDTGGSRVAAQVLLGLYNGNCFHVDLTEVCGNLDSHYFRSALIAIKGRSIHGCWVEPHTVIENGNEHFHTLWKQWEHLHTDNRYKG